MNYKTICVLGGTGFIGTSLVSRLIDSGRRVKVLTRHPERHRHLQVLPGLSLIEADVHDPEALASHFKGCDAVINLVGILNEKRHDGSGFRQAHVELARKTLEACKAVGITRLLHMSALNADAGSGPSHYLRTKGEAENLVHTFATGLAVTSFRPSVVFGPGDSFLNRFADLLRTAPLALPLTCPRARFAPVYVGDVSEAFMQALEDKASFGQRYELCGPREYTLKELVGYAAGLMGMKRRIVGLPDWLSHTMAVFFEYLWPGKVFSLDNYHSLQKDSTCVSGARCPTALEAVAPTYLGQRGHQARMQYLRTGARRA